MADFSTPDLGISIALANIGAYQGQLARARAATDRAMGGVEQATSRATASFQKLSSEVPLLGRAFELARNPVVALGAALVGTIAVFGNAINTARQFESQLASTAAIAQVERTSEAFKALNDEAQRLGTTTEFSATQAAQAMEFLARAGFNTNEILQATESTLALATVGNLELARSADIASNVLAQFNKDASELPSVVDAIAKTTVTANTNVEQFAEAMKYLGPTAAALGVSLEESSAAIGILSNSGLQGSLATRAFGTSLTRLAAPTEKARAEMERLGIQAFDAQGNFVGIAGVIRNLEDSFAGLSQEQRQGALATIFGAEAIQEYNILLSAGSKAIEDYTKEIQSASAQNGKFAQSVREAKLDTFQGAIISLKSAWEGFQIAIAQGALPVLKEVTFGIAGFVRGATAMVQVLKDNADLLLILVPAIATYNSTTIAAAASSLYQATAERAKAAAQAISAALTTRFIGLQAAYITVTNLLIGRITAATAAQQLWNIAVSANPLGLILAGVTAAAAAFVIYRRSVESTSKVLRDQLGKARSEIIDSYTKERAELDTVFKALASDSTAREEKAKLIDRVNSKYGDLLENQITEKSSLEDLKKAHDQLSASILNQLVTEAKAKTAQALFNSILEATNKKIQVQAGYVQENTSWWERTRASLVAFAAAQYGIVRSSEDANKAIRGVIASDAQGQIDQYKSELDGLSTRFGEIQKALQEQFKGIDFTKLFQGFEDGLQNLGLGKAAAGSLKALEDRLSSLQDKLNQSTPDAKLFADIQKQIQSVNQEIERVKLLQVRVQVERPDLSVIDSQIETLQQKAKNILLELDKIQIRPALDLSGLPEEAQKAAVRISAIEAAAISLKIGGIEGVDSAIASIEKEVSGLEAKLSVTTEPGEILAIQAQIDALKAKASETQRVKVIFEEEGAEAVLKEIERIKAENPDVKFSGNVDFASVLREVDLTRGKIEALKAVDIRLGLDPGGIDSALSDLEGKLSDLKATFAFAADPGELETLQQKILEIESQIKTIEDVRVSVQLSGAGAIEAEINRLESSLSGLQAVQVEASLKDNLTSQLQSVQEEIERTNRLKVTMDLSGLTEEAQKAAVRISAIEAAAISLKIGGIEGVDSAIASIEKEVSGLEAKLSVTTEPGEILAIQAQIDALKAKASETQRVKVIFEEEGAEAVLKEIDRIKAENPDIAFSASADFASVLREVDLTRGKIEALKAVRFRIDTDTQKAETAIALLQAELASLNTKLSITTDLGEIQRIESDIASIQSKIGEIGVISVTTAGVDTALSDLNSKLSGLKAMVQVTTDAGALQALTDEIEGVEQQIATIEDVRVNVQLSGAEAISNEIARLETSLAGIGDVELVASMKDTLTASLQAIQAEIKKTNRLKVAIQSEGIGAIDKEIGAAQAKLLSLTRQLQAAPDNTVFSQISGQIKDTRQEIETLNRFRVEVSSESIEALTSRVNVLKSALGSLAPDSGQFRAINEEIRKLDERIAQARIFQVQVSGDKSIDALSEQLRILKERINQVQPNPEVLTPMILKIQELEREVEKANRLKIQIEAGVTVSLPEIAAATIDVPAISIPVKIDDSAAGQLAKLVNEAGKLTAMPLDSMAEAARKLGLDMRFVSANFSTYQALQTAATSGAYMFAQSLGATSQQAIEFAVGLQVLGEEIQRQIVGGAVRAFEAFGAELAKSITQGNSAISAFEALFKGLVRVILVDVPKLIGTFLIQTGVGLAFPAGIPFVVAGAALVGMSGLIGGLLDASASKQEVPLPDTSSAIAAGFGRSSGPVALGLSSYNPAGREQQIVVQPSFYVESDGILREIEIRQIIRNENLRGG